jgi:hypothetical protein
VSDPKRLLDDASGAPHVAALLGALPKPQPPSAQKEAELVQRLLTPIAPVPVAAGLALKGWLGVGALVVAGGLGGGWLLSRPAAPVLQPRVTSVVPSPLLPPPAITPRAAPPNVEPPSRAAASPAPSAVKAVARDTLAEEEALLEQARRSLASSPGAALALLRQHQQRFPAGQLTAERLFLSVDALRRVGDRAGAERQAQVLLKRFPGSVYAGQLRGPVGQRAPAPPTSTKTPR